MPKTAALPAGLRRISLPLLRRFTPAGAAKQGIWLFFYKIKVNLWITAGKIGRRTR